jgi:hypothetical protein
MAVRALLKITFCPVLRKARDVATLMLAFS